jgi:hypothetical protein
MTRRAQRAAPLRHVRNSISETPHATPACGAPDDIKFQRVKNFAKKMINCANQSEHRSGSSDETWDERWSARGRTDFVLSVGADSRHGTGGIGDG